jgi:hypothetical protein
LGQKGGLTVNGDPSDPKRALVDRLLAEYKPNSKGSSVDSDRIRSVVLDNPDLIAETFPPLLRWNREHNVGIWGLLFVVAMVYKAECGDDSLEILLNTAANEAKVKLPSVLSYTPNNPAPQPKVVVLETAKDDIRAGDAHRMLTVMRIDTMSPEVREKILGKCVITFPVDNDPRPIQRIPEVRRFVADIHKRMRYFPMYLNFDPKLEMHLVYFGCLAEESATEWQGAQIGINLLHRSVTIKIKEALTAIREVCVPLGLYWKQPVREILLPFDHAVRQSVFGNEWDV